MAGHTIRKLLVGLLLVGSAALFDVGCASKVKRLARADDQTRIAMLREEAAAGDTTLATVLREHGTPDFVSVFNVRGDSGELEFRYDSGLRFVLRRTEGNFWSWRRRSSV